MAKVRRYGVNRGKKVFYFLMSEGKRQKSQRERSNRRKAARRAR